MLCSWPAALSHESALRADEGPGRRDRDESLIHVAVDRSRNVVEPPGVRVHRMTRLDVIFELDGRLFHTSTLARDHDMDRDLDAAVAGTETIRLSYGQVFDRPCRTARKIAAVLARHGWGGRPRPCEACPAQSERGSVEE